jgi:hypothetical protein
MLRRAYQQPLNFLAKPRNPPSMTYDRPESAGTGYLRRNEKKSKPSQPDHTGSATVAGQKYHLSAWVNEGDDGRKYFKITFRPDQERPEEPRQQGGGRMPVADNEIPF